MAAKNRITKYTRPQRRQTKVDLHPFARDGEVVDDDGIHLVAGTGTWVSPELIDLYHSGALGDRKTRKLWILSMLSNSRRPSRRRNGWFGIRIGYSKKHTTNLISELIKDGFVISRTKHGQRTLHINWKVIWSWVKRRDDLKRERGFCVPFIITSAQICGTHALLWSYADSFRLKGKGCIASDAHLALQIGRLHRITANRAIGKLVELGLMKRKYIRLPNGRKRRQLIPIAPRDDMDYSDD